MREKNNECAVRRPDCVTEILRGNPLLVICEFYKQNTTVAVADKIMKVLEAEFSAGLLDIKGE